MTDVYPYDNSMGRGDRWLGGEMKTGSTQLGEPIRLELVFNSIEGMSYDDFLLAMSAFQTIVDVAVDEALDGDVLGIWLERPWLELTRIQTGSEFKFQAILRNTNVQKRALTVTLLIAALATSVGLADAGVRAYESHNQTQVELQKAQTEAKRVELDYDLKRKELEYEAVKMVREQVQSALPLEKPINAKNKAKRVAEKVAPSCVALSGLPVQPGAPKPSLASARVDETFVVLRQNPNSKRTTSCDAPPEFLT